MLFKLLGTLSEIPNSGFGKTQKSKKCSNKSGNMNVKLLIVGIIGLLVIGVFIVCIYTKEHKTGKLLAWTKESSIRIEDGVSSATVVIDNMYVMYYTAGGGIRAAKSYDGLTFEKVGVVVGNGEAGSQQEMVTNPAIIKLSDGSYRMIYEGSQHLAERQDRRLFSAFSVDGFNWTKEAGVRFQDYGDGKPDELFTSVPDTIRLDNGDLRMYYARGITSATALSQDNGVTWMKEGNLDLGRIAIDPDIIRLDDGSYKLFFTTFDSEFGIGKQYVMSASSTDGITFVLDNGKRLEPSLGKELVVDPDIIRLPDGSYRMYYGETGTDMLFDIYSAISE